MLTSPSDRGQWTDTDSTYTSNTSPTSVSSPYTSVRSLPPLLTTSKATLPMYQPQRPPRRDYQQPQFRDVQTHTLDHLHYVDSPLLEEGAIEAAWEDESCIDVTELQERKQGDAFEVEALRRQVEQLQMALQLQSYEREMDKMQLRETRRTVQVRAAPLSPPTGPLPLPSSGDHPYSIRQSTLTDISSLSSGRTLASSQAEDQTKIDDLNRKVEALANIVASMHSAPAPSPGALHFSPTPAQPRLSSTSSSIRSTSTATSSSAPSSTAKKSSKFAAALGLGDKEESRVSWSRKRTEKVPVPKAKVRQGPGRGRMIVTAKST